MSSLNPILVIRYPFIVISSPFQYHQFTFSLSSIYPFFFSFLDQSLLFLVQSLLLPCPIFTPSLLNLYSFLVQSLLLPCSIFTLSLFNLCSFLVQALLLSCSIFTPSLSNLYSFLVQSLLLPCQIFTPSLYNLYSFLANLSSFFALSSFSFVLLMSFKCSFLLLSTFVLFEGRTIF